MTDDRERFARIFDEHYPAVLAYAARRTDPDSAKDVAAETLLVAWRRLQDVPGHPLPWLLVVARNTLSNRSRSEYRRAATEAEAAWLTRVRATNAGFTDAVDDRLEVLAALATLSPRDRETLMLVAWDGLSSGEAAEVAGCSTATFHVRLHRARARLEKAMSGDAPDAAVDTAGPSAGRAGRHRAVPTDVAVPSATTEEIR